LLLANGWRLQTPITDFHRLVYRHAWRTTKKKPGRFVDRAFYSIPVYLQFRINTTWSYWYMIILFLAAINTYHSLRVRTRIPLTKSS
jgi:hypothetical protein